MNWKMSLKTRPAEAHGCERADSNQNSPFLIVKCDPVSESRTWSVLLPSCGRRLQSPSNENRKKKGKGAVGSCPYLVLSKDLE